MTTDFDDLQLKLQANNQEHLVQFWDELNDEERSHLVEQIEAIDFEQIQQLTHELDKDQVWAELSAKAKPPQAIRLGRNEPIVREDAIKAGEDALRAGRVGMVLVAGGQGTRLGFDFPKGMYPLGPISKRTLFQIHFEKVIALGRKYGSKIPFFVMTSPATHEQSVEFIEKNNRFGMAAADMQVFCQGSMPAVDSKSGSILLESKSSLFTAPNGHGGTITALEEYGCLKKMKEQGIEHVFYCQVDNPMVQICDPLTLGYHILQQSELTTQACPKRSALQKVGNIVEVEGRVCILEYSDLPDEIAQQTNEDGSLRLWAGNIAVHIFGLDFLCSMVNHADALPFHLANKKVSYIDGKGNLVEPEEPNAIKFERFIFDLLPMAKNALVVEVDPASAFSPVKNAADAPSETAATAQAAMIKQARTWLSEIGIEVADTIDVEINPLFAVSPIELAEKLNKQTKIESPTYFH